MSELKKIYWGTAAVSEFEVDADGNMHIRRTQLLGSLDSLISMFMGSNTISDDSGDKSAGGTVKPEDLAALPPAPAGPPDMGATPHVPDEALAVDEEVFEVNSEVIGGDDGTSLVDSLFPDESEELPTTNAGPTQGAVGNPFVNTGVPDTVPVNTEEELAYTPDASVLPPVNDQTLTPGAVADNSMQSEVERLASGGEATPVAAGDVPVHEPSTAAEVATQEVDPRLQPSQEQQSMSTANSITEATQPQQEATQPQQEATQPQQEATPPARRSNKEMLSLLTMEEREGFRAKLEVVIQKPLDVRRAALKRAWRKTAPENFDAMDEQQINDALFNTFLKTLTKGR